MVGSPQIIRTNPVTKRMFELGYSATGLWRVCMKETGQDISYSHFMNIISGRAKNRIVEEWIIRKGFEKELKKAQEHALQVEVERAKERYKILENKLKQKRGGDNIER